MQAIDKVATIRNVETLFLHVDVLNSGALRLYKEAGYEIIKSTDHIFADFTRSLNLHDGATQGRNHFLLRKNMKEPTWLPLPEKGTLGFDLLDIVAIDQV